MKGIILAGGSGDRLWPLSRKNYPKQFMEIRKGRSLFQETLLRNMPFCDEFIIATNIKYESIVKSQLQDFQDLKYSVIMEDAPLKTAISIVTLALNSDIEEEFLIVSTDNIIDGEYNSYITRLKTVIKNDKIAVVVTSPKHGAIGNHYVEKSGKHIRFVSDWNKNCFFDSGVIGCKVSTLLCSVDKDFLQKCKHVSIKANRIVESKNNPAEHKSLVNVLKTDNIELVKSKFSCIRITDIVSYYNSLGKEQDFSNVVEYMCKNVKIINSVSDKLVFAHNLKDIVVANTRDAVYIAKVDSKKGIKAIPRNFTCGRERFFDEYPVFYYEWGISETLIGTENYKVNKITLYPKNTLIAKSEKRFFTNFLVLDGEIAIEENGKETRICGNNENVAFCGGKEYSITNAGKRNVTLLKTENVQNNDAADEIAGSGCFVKLSPAFKDYIWGGTLIRDKLKKDAGTLTRIAESWELSAHPAGESVIATGKYAGKSLSLFLSHINKDNLGWKACDYDRFPLMIKFIDAKESLSVQVHPNDEYAFSKEGDYGKNEMWYIMDAAKDAFIYVGFKKDVTKEEITERISKGTIEEILNKIPVQKGETYFLRSGTVHAICAGCFICEIQQSSNITYRLYDYNRTEANGQPRELKIEDALTVADLTATDANCKCDYSVIKFQGYSKQLLGQCKYFVVTKYDINGELTLAPNGASFKAVVVIDGEGKIDNGSNSYDTSSGDTWFCGSKEIVNLQGKMTILVANI
ncbi:MAG: type I phosphomannose isomerase catalytic subunit [Christensenellaceae bacterium]